MRISKAIFSILVLLSVLVSVNCGGNFDDEDISDSKTPSSCPVPTVTRTSENSEAFYTVMADHNLTEEHKTAILQALNEWSVKTNHTLTYKLTFIDMSAVTPDVTNPHTIKVYVRDPGPGLLGWTTWSASNHSAYMFIAPTMDKNWFRKVMLHELGHAFDLSFENKDPHYNGPYQSIMHPSISEETSGLCCPEIKAFCEKNCCDVDCHYELPTPATAGAAIKAIPIAEHQVD